MFESIAHPRKRAFLQAFALTGSVTAASQASGISRESHYDWKSADAAYRAAFEGPAIQMAGDLLEEEARRRAHDGVCELVLHKGEPVLLDTGRKDERGRKIIEPYYRKRYSDRLLAVLLAGAKPDKYGKKTVEHSGAITVNLAERLQAARKRIGHSDDKQPGPGTGG